MNVSIATGDQIPIDDSQKWLLASRPNTQSSSLAHEATASESTSDHCQCEHVMTDAKPPSSKPTSTVVEERPRAILIPASEIVATKVSWLWEGYIALGKLTMLVGDPGVGKSFLSLDLAARVSKGDTWPDGSTSHGGSGSVILISSEDGRADTIKPRLSAAGADVARINFFDPLDADGDQPAFNLNRHISNLEYAVGQAKDTRLIVIDPLTAFGGGVNERSQGAVREMLQPLADMAARLGVAILLISHPNKNEGGKAAYRTTGSLAYNAVCRAVWYVVRHPEDPDRRLLLAVKNNLAKDTQGRAFRIVAEGRLEWEPDPVSLTVDEVLAAETRARHKTSSLDEAVAYLKQALTLGPMPVHEVYKSGAKVGLSERTLDRAKKAVEIESVKFKTKQGMKYF
jgi:hypothetical protein